MSTKLNDRLQKESVISFQAPDTQIRISIEDQRDQKGTSRTRREMQEEKPRPRKLERTYSVLHHGDLVCAACSGETVRDEYNRLGAFTRRGAPRECLHGVEDMVLCVGSILLLVSLRNLPSRAYGTG